MVESPSVLKRIIVADDNGVMRALLSASLSAGGYQVQLAVNGLDALEQLRREQPDLVMLDLQMPVLDGLETIRQIRGDPALRNLRVIAITAFASPDNIARAENAGFDAVLPKPVDRKALLSAVADVLAPDMIPLAAIEAARDRIRPHVRRTPLWHSRALSDRLGVETWVKLELFQLTGSFKLRGALNKALQLAPADRVRGLVAVSGGNHAQGVACAAAQLGIPALILMPANVPAHYLAATRGYGAEVELHPDTRAAFAAIEKYRREGWAEIHPFDDTEVMAGAATAGLEIVEDLPTVTDVVVSVGGGGLAGGLASAIKGMRPAARVWGVETEGADCMSRSLAAGEIVTLAAVTSVARTLGAPAPSAHTLALAQELLEEVAVVSDAAAVAAQQFLLERLKVLTEPAASCTLAAADQLRVRYPQDANLVLFLCGGNEAVPLLH